MCCIIWIFRFLLTTCCPTRPTASSPTPLRHSPIIWTSLTLCLRRTSGKLLRLLVTFYVLSISKIYIFKLNPSFWPSSWQLFVRNKDVFFIYVTSAEIYFRTKIYDNFFAWLRKIDLSIQANMYMFLCPIRQLAYSYII